ERQQRRPGEHRRRGTGVERQDARRAVQRARFHHAPSRLWPQTRTMLPLTPAEAGAANPGIASATSRGRPPRDMLFLRRPASRTGIGIAAVILVSTKPGATALIVALRSASSGASASTMPITPAFEVA